MAGNLVLIRTERQLTLASTFLRFQEHYESPEFRNKIFSLEEFRIYYENKFGSFTYYKDWSGFNIPSSILELFREGKFDPLSEEEQHLLNLLADIPEPFYLVGIYGKKLDLPTLKHELVHGLFYTVPEYRKEVLQVIGAQKIDSLTKALKNAGYHHSVWPDETNAYLMMCADDLRKDGFRWTSSLRSLQKDLRQVFRRYFSFSLRRADSFIVLNFFHSIKL